MNRPRALLQLLAGFVVTGFIVWLLLTRT